MILIVIFALCNWIVIRVNNISAFNRAKALLVLLNLEIVDLEQLKTMLSIAMKNEPPSAMVSSLYTTSFP